MPSSATFDLKGIKTVRVRTFGVHKIGNQYEETILPPIVIFKNLTKAPKNTFPKGMVIEDTMEVPWRWSWVSYLIQ